MKIGSHKCQLCSKKSKHYPREKGYEMCEKHYQLELKKLPKKSK